MPVPVPVPGAASGTGTGTGSGGLPGYLAHPLATRTSPPLAVSTSQYRPIIFPGKAVAHGPARPRTPDIFFEPMSKRRRGFPSEARVKRGRRVVHGDKELLEKVGRNDLCPCGFGQRFKKCCRNTGRF